MFGMRCTVVHNETELDAAVADAKRDGMRLACTSNTGLPVGDYRLTFLPASAFTDNETRPIGQPIVYRR